jgi:hypothetical protein
MQVATSEQRRVNDAVLEIHNWGIQYKDAKNHYKILILSSHRRYTELFEGTYVLSPTFFFSFVCKISLKSFRKPYAKMQSRYLPTKPMALDGESLNAVCQEDFLTTIGWQPI